MYDDDYMPPDTPSTSNAYIPIVGQILSSVSDCVRCIQHETTERAALTVKKETAIAMIKSRKKILLTYLCKRFAERTRLYQAYFRLIDAALAADNTDIVQSALEGIRTVYSASAYESKNSIYEQYDKPDDEGDLYEDIDYD